MVLPATAAVRYVNLNNPTPAPPYTNWATAARTIQDAVDVTVDGDEVLVTNGVYRTGGRRIVGPLTNRVAVTNAIMVRSVNGPAVTMIEGFQTNANYQSRMRCVFLTNGGALAGFTLTNGAGLQIYYIAFQGMTVPVFDDLGGGVWCASVSSVVSNCVITGNGGGAFGGKLENCTLLRNEETGAFQCVLINCLLADNTDGGAFDSTLNNCTLKGNSAREGGGARYSTLNNCLLIGNVAIREDGDGGGGGAFHCWLTNCTLIGNAAEYGGGASDSVLNNCIAYFNTDLQGIGPNYVACTLNSSCTTPLPVDGTSNLTNEPAFLDLAGGNLRLASNSPCLNAGDNAFAPGATDLDGRARITGGTVDMGAYEFQPGVSGVFLGWLQQFGLRTDGTDDTLDTDDDHANNFQEWRAGTIPTNAFSTLRALTPTASGPDLVLRWASVPGKSYFLTRSTNLTTGTGFVPFAQNLSGQPSTTTYTDTNAASSSGRNYFYPVGVEP